jgi:CPA2 family monovalent cation:H+ antiporter-2
MGLASWWGWDTAAALVFGLSLSCASTVVLLKALDARGMLESGNGRIAVGWLVVEDLATVLMLVLMPPLAGLLAGASGGESEAALWRTVGLTLLQVGAFVAIMLVAGRRALPWLLWQVARTGSRELFTLGVIAAAIGIAVGAAHLFSVSYALGAFFAGMVMRESEFSHRAAEESLPLRDAFAVLFFVSVGMLFDPSIVIDAIGPLLAVLAIILVGKAAVSTLFVLALRQPLETALTIGAGRTQLGEFSFILMSLAVSLDLIPELGRNLILAGAVGSIMVNPLAFSAAEWLRRRFEKPAPEAVPAELPTTSLSGHAVLVGYGRVGSVIGEACRARGEKLIVIEEAEPIVERLHAEGIEALPGQAPPDALLEAANIAQAKLLFVAIPNSFEAGQFVEQARASNPGLTIVARAHSNTEAEYLEKLGANATVMGEREIAGAMIGRGFV